MEDFDPARVAEQVPVLNELLQMRKKLTELLGKMEGNDALEKLLADVIGNTEKKQALLDALAKAGDEPRRSNADASRSRGIGGRNLRRPPFRLAHALRTLRDSTAPLPSTHRWPPKKPKPPPPTTTTEFDPAKWLDQVADKMKVTDDAAARRRGLAALNEFIASAVQPGQVVSKDVETNIKLWIGEIDKKLTAQLNEVLHHPAFQKLEGTWRGLHYLVHQSETGEHLKIRVLNVTKDELCKDLEKAVEFDMSETFKKVYEEEYGKLGGHPYGMLVGDYEFESAAPRTSSCCRDSPASRPRPTPRSSAASARSCSTSTASPSWPTRATWPRSSPARVRRLEVVPRVGGLAGTSP